MYRDIIKTEYEWEKNYSKSLIMSDACKTGKTWLMKSFGENSIKRTLYINLEIMSR